MRILAGGVLLPQMRARIDFGIPVQDHEVVSVLARPHGSVRIERAAPTHVILENISESQRAWVVITAGHAGRSDAARKIGLLDLLAGLLNADITLTGGSR